MKRNLMLKKVLSFVIMLSILVMTTIPSYAHSDLKKQNNNILYNENNATMNSFSEEIQDDKGNILHVETERIPDLNIIKVRVYVNKGLTQISLVDGNKIYYKDLTNNVGKYDYKTFDPSEYDKVYDFDYNLSFEFLWKFLPRQGI